MCPPSTTAPPASPSTHPRAEGAVNILFRPDEATTRQAKIDDYNQRFATPFVAAENGFIDAVIEPRQTRLKLIRGLRMLENKKDSLPRKKHGNIPL